MVFHVINRANGRVRIFDKDADYAAFERVMAQTLELVAMRLLAYCIMPNHWHLVLWPRHDGDLAAFMQRLTVTHVRRWHAHRHSDGTGHLYQGTYKSFPIQQDDHFLTVCRYVERNPLRAKLVRRAENWPWSSLRPVSRGDTPARPRLTAWPVQRPRGWVERVNAVETAAERDAVLQSVRRGRPFGDPSWQVRIAERLDLTQTLRPRGRPRKPASAP